MSDLPFGPEDRRLDPDEFAQAMARQLAATTPKKRLIPGASYSISTFTLIGIAFGAGILIASTVVWLSGGFSGRTSDEVLGAVVTTTSTTEAQTTTTLPETTTTIPPTTTVQPSTSTTGAPTTTAATDTATTTALAPSVTWIRCNGAPCESSYPRGPAIAVTFQCSSASSCVGEFAYPGQEFKVIRSGDRMYTTFFSGEHRIRVTASKADAEAAVVEHSFSTP